MKVSEIKFEPHHFAGQINKIQQVALALKHEVVHKHARVEFPNGHVVSVITGDLFYTTPKKPYEAWVLTSNRKKYQNPLGYLNEKDLQKLLDRVESWKSLKK